ncbi:MAG: hypothetical protein Q7R56_02490 [Nanoarchaeota archaeon]|nr:hypothetical protein [Nanoarchaeota archaeon]
MTVRDWGKLEVYERFVKERLIDWIESCREQNKTPGEDEVSERMFDVSYKIVDLLDLPESIERRAKTLEGRIVTFTTAYDRFERFGKLENEFVVSYLQSTGNYWNDLADFMRKNSEPLEGIRCAEMAEKESKELLTEATEALKERTLEYECKNVLPCLRLMLENSSAMLGIAIGKEKNSYYRQAKDKLEELMKKAGALTVI